MIARVWRGYTTLANAAAYAATLQPELLPGLSQKPGFGGSYLLRREVYCLARDPAPPMAGRPAYAAPGRGPRDPSPAGSRRIVPRGRAALRNFAALRADLTHGANGATPASGEVEFVTIMLWESLDAIRALTGPDYETAVIPEERRRYLVRYDAKATHYEVAAPATPPAAPLP